jgi:hypothetical protein
VALAVENALTRDALQQRKASAEGAARTQPYTDDQSGLGEVIPEICVLMGGIRHDYARVAVYDEAARALSLYSLDSPLTHGLKSLGSKNPALKSLMSPLLTGISSTSFSDT